MSRTLPFQAGILVALVALPGGAAAQEQETLRLSQALYYDCTIASAEAPEAAVEFDISYWAYADNPLKPQVNFRDPAKVAFRETGWGAKGDFVLTRLISDGRLFIWAGATRDATGPAIDTSIELTPKQADPGSVGIALTHFDAGDGGAVSARKFDGDCKMLTGEAAFYASQGDGQ